MSDEVSADVLRLTAKIVSAHLVKNPLSAAELPALIQAVYRSLASMGKPEALSETKVPAVLPKKSVFPDYIICLEDGKRLKMLRRHLASSYNLTPDEYRAKWGLPRDYPMVAPVYARKRSELAKKNWLGRKPAPPPEVQVLPARRARGVKHARDAVRGFAGTRT